MFQHRSSFAVPFTSFFLTEDDGKNPPVPPAKPEKPQFDDAQQKHINDLLAAERKNAEERTEQRVRDEQAEKDRQAEEARQRDEQAKRGEFDQVRKDLEGKLTAADSEKQAIAAERDALADYFNGQYQSALKDLPEVVTAFAPAEDASFAVKQAWLTKAVEQAAKHQSQAPGYRVPPTPQPQGRGNPTEQQMAEKMRPRISI